MSSSVNVLNSSDVNSASSSSGEVGTEMPPKSVTVGPARWCHFLATLLAPRLIADVPVLAAHLSIAGQPSESEVARAQPRNTLSVLGAIIKLVAVTVAVD
eukprot:scaffold49487_cov42-Phaeocystis_antarctica.AAC.2